MASAGAQRGAAPAAGLDLLEAALRLARSTGGGARFRFVSEPLAAQYLAVLLCLHGRRRAHEIEVAHDDLLADVAPALEALGGEPADSVSLRPLLEKLREWGNVSERVEATRIRSLADRARSKLLLRLEAETAAFLSFLEARAAPQALGAGDEGANLLADIQGHLREAATWLKRGRSGAGGPGGPGRGAAADEALSRAAYLVRESDRKTDRIADELVRFADALASFVAEPFRMAALEGVASWLAGYVERYLAVLEERGRSIRRSLGALRHRRHADLWERATAVEAERVAHVPVLVATAPPRTIPDVLLDLGAFFDGREGLLALCRRVNQRTREAIRRIQRHVEAVRLHNVRIEAIRARTAELFRLPAGPDADAAAKAFVEELVAAAHVVTDGREGTPASKAAPPRPARRHESARPAFRGAPLATKTGAPGQARDLELRRLSVLSRFIEEHVLRGRARALLSDARVGELLDARRVVAAVLAHQLRGGRARQHLGFALERAAGRAVLETDELVLDAPEWVVTRRRNP